MTRAKGWIGIALTGLLGLGCGENLPVTAPDQPSLAKGVAQSPPTNSGPIVFRVNGQLFVVNFDFARGLAALHFDIANPPTFPGFYEGCAAPNQGDNLDVQFVFSNSGQFHEMIRLLDAHVAVYDIRALADPFTAVFTCEFLADLSRRLAVGTAHFDFSDNDLFGTGPGGNAVRSGAQGQLLSPSGQRIQYVEVMNFVIRPDGTFAPGVQMIKLTPDPRP